MDIHQSNAGTFVKPEPLEGMVLPPPQQSAMSEWDQLRQRAEEDCFNESAWDALIDYAEDSGDNEKIKQAYDALLQKYPNTSSVQIAYLNHFLVNQATFPYAEMLFARFLRASTSVDLWKFYIIYVRRLNVGPETRDTVTKSYEFALQHVGQDKDSADIWSEYIQFIKSGSTSSTWEEQQKMDALRKVYQRAVQIPLENVEILWKDYEAFENQLNKITAKKFLQDLTPAYMQARTKLRDLRKYLNPLFPSQLSSRGGRAPFNLPKKPKFSTSERGLVGSWKQYLKWEEGNPLEIEDKASFFVRMQGVYRKAVVRMRFFSEIWFMAYSWTSSIGRSEEALQLLKAGIEANPTSFILNFALAEALELAKNFTDVHATYTNLLQAVLKELEELEVKVQNDSSANSSFENGGLENGADPSTQDLFPGLGKEVSQATINSTSSSSSTEESPVAKQFKERKQEYGLIYIMYIRFAMRAEGLPASRGVFTKARKDKYAPWEVFESAALMEYHVAKESTVANRILSVAMNRFPTEIDFVVRYLTFLMSINDENNARALFERTVTTFPPDKARPLWERWARYEYQYGNLEAALKLEKRMADVYPSDPPIKRFAQRHIYASIDGIANRDLGVAQARQAASLGRVDTVPAITVGAPPHSSASFAQPYTNGSAPAVGAAGIGAGKQPSSPDMRSDRGLKERDERERDRERSMARRDDMKPPLKRTRDNSPVPAHSKERDRWAGPQSNRRYNSPGWQDQGDVRGDRWGRNRDRDRERERSPVRRYQQQGHGGPHPQDREDGKVALPQVINWFVGKLPHSEAFDGPVFRTDDLMQLFRNAVIPGSTPRERTPPPLQRPAHISHQPRAPLPPDYGQYRSADPRVGRY